MFPFNMAAEGLLTMLYNKSGNPSSRLILQRLFFLQLKNWWEPVSLEILPSIQLQKAPKSSFLLHLQTLALDSKIGDKHTAEAQVKMQPDAALDWPCLHN